MIWLLAQPLPLHPAVSSTGDTHRKTKKERLLADGGGERGWARSKIIRPQESLVLYKSFNIRPGRESRVYCATMLLSDLNRCRYIGISQPNVSWNTYRTIHWWLGVLSRARVIVTMYCFFLRYMYYPISRGAILIKSYIWLTASSYMVKYCICAYPSPSLYMTVQCAPIPSEFPYTYMRKIFFSFFNSVQ